MIEFKWWAGDGAGRHAGYDRITSLICWLLFAMVSLYANLLPIERDGAVLLAISCFALFCYRSAAGRLLPDSEFKRGVELLLILFLVVLVCWFTGRSTSPFVCLIYLLLMMSSLTLGGRITSLLAGCSMACYLWLALAQPPYMRVPSTADFLQLLPFLLAAHLAALLAREAESVRAEVERLSLTDDLTELNNMRSFDNLARQQERLAKRYRKPFSICMLDADNLKEVNDRHGHLAGTELIKWTARIIGQHTRECDIAARFGGDEFVIMYEGHDKEQIRPAVERIVRLMAATPFTFEGELVTATLSAGIASYPADGHDLRTVIMRADEAMYRSKRLGKNMVSVCRQETAKQGRGALQVGGEQLGRAVPELHRKSAAVHLGEGDLPGGGQGDGASLLEDSGER